MAELLADRKLDWTEIGGWLTVAEGRVLQSLAMGKRVLELGTWKGRSAICMAQTADFVACVDHFRGDRNSGPADTRIEFLANLKRAGVEDRVGWIACTAGECEAYLHPWSIDLAYVDVEHSEAATIEALGVARRNVKPGGVIAWHDADRAEVRAAVAAAGLEPISHAGSLEWCTV